MSFDVNTIRAQFPILSEEVYGKPLVYLDNAASVQKPVAVIDRMTGVMTGGYANVHRGLHYMSNKATADYEAARKTAATYLNAASPDEIIFTMGGTDAINLVANSLGVDQIGKATRSFSVSWSITPTSSPGISCGSGRALSSNGWR